MSKRHQVELPPATQRWLSGSSFEPAADAVSSELVGRGYAIGTVRN